MRRICRCLCPGRCRSWATVSMSPAPRSLPITTAPGAITTSPPDPDFTHVSWTDNRNVVQPADGDWANYTPPTYGNSTTSIFDPTQQRPACTALTSGNTRDRNQDVYTAQLSPGLVVSARGNAKQLGTASNGQLMQREFPITVQNTSGQVRFYELTINSQPMGGSASFLQFQVEGLPFPFTQIDTQVPAFSSVSRSMFVTSTDAHASVSVSVAEITGSMAIPYPAARPAQWPLIVTSAIRIFRIPIFPTPSYIIQTSLIPISPTQIFRIRTSQIRIFPPQTFPIPVFLARSSLTRIFRIPISPVPLSRI